MPNVVDTENSLEEYTSEVLFHPRIANSKGGEDQERVDDELPSELSLFTGQVVVRLRGNTLSRSVSLFESQQRGYVPLLPDDETNTSFGFLHPRQQTTTGVFSISDWVLSDANFEPAAEAPIDLPRLGSGSASWLDRHWTGILEIRDLERGWDANLNSVTGDPDLMRAINLASWTGAFGYYFTSSAPWLDGLLGKLEEMRNLRPGWDSYGALPPNDWALAIAEKAIKAFANCGVQPDKVLPSVENGVGISVTRGERYGFLEVLNSQGVVGITACGKDTYEVLEFDPDSIAECVERICAFANG